MDVHPTKNVSIGIDPYPYKFTMIFMFRATQVPQKTPICVAAPRNEACQMRPADVSSSVGERGALGHWVHGDQRAAARYSFITTVMAVDEL